MSLADVDTLNNDHVLLWHCFYNFAGLTFILAGQYEYCIVFLYVHDDLIKQLQEQEK